MQLELLSVFIGLLPQIVMQMSEAYPRLLTGGIPENIPLVLNIIVFKIK